MRATPLGTDFSATDLGVFLECPQRTVLELEVAHGRLERPAQNDIERRLLELRGLDHEQRVLEYFGAQGREVVSIPVLPGAEGAARSAEVTLRAMIAGADLIYQGALQHEGWTGRPDFLQKVSGAAQAQAQTQAQAQQGRHWPHHYEAIDAKLSREAKAQAVLQLCVYTEQFDLKRSIRSSVPHPRSLIVGKPIDSAALALSLLALGEVVARGSEGFEAGRRLLLRQPPQAGLPGGGPLVREGEAIEIALERLALGLKGSVLAVQGPPGSGKTHQAALMIAALLRRGQRVGVTAIRLNVAMSRAQALAVLVASPELWRVSCKTPRQIKLVNALCAYLEGASGRP